MVQVLRLLWRSAIRPKLPSSRSQSLTPSRSIEAAPEWVRPHSSEIDLGRMTEGHAEAVTANRMPSRTTPANHGPDASRLGDAEGPATLRPSAGVRGLAPRA